MAAKNEVEAASYGNAKAVADFKDQSQEAAIYELTQCQPLVGDEAVKACGEMYCSFTGKFGTLDFVLQKGRLGWTVVAAYGGAIE
ncbi:hypothetical protein [Pengzhenrongella sp.]|jgi:hypothetical protein|uniref:hypothetical protein n=1 Tax=Pengzhenrongella sp. TaxID=2888820 RepID=UPI002F9211C4